ncbi:ras-related protein Rab-34-like isoform X4 [Phyllopteryx taeniolatus]|uniref:ras-related protein Rab-34-like isoform X4 n=1 Tax=Phyllopteryx taeniolatus TaxID=161469 RepID=UPI002AD3B44C|nr:ras-related protein Rab-34-like isoform X4 [Phyllopteryx taeniolatus]
MHVFGMWDETGVPRKKPTQARTERTCKLHKANPGPQNSQAVTSILTRAWTWTWIQCNIMLLPTKSDRIITDLPKCFSPKAALQTKEVFHTQVQAACQTHREDAVSFNVAKVIVVGDVSVGKTCLVSRFCTGAFDKNYKATIGVDFDMERFQVLGVPFSLQLWDTAGQERFKCIASTYYRGAQAIIVVFDLSRGSSLVHARQWLEDALKENDPSGVLLFLVGTKKDLSVVSRGAGSGGTGSRSNVRGTQGRVLGCVGKVGRWCERFLLPRGLFDLRGQRSVRAGKTTREHRRHHQDLGQAGGRAQAGQEEVRLLLM